MTARTFQVVGEVQVDNDVRFYDGRNFIVVPLRALVWWLHDEADDCVELHLKYGASVLLDLAGSSAGAGGDLMEALDREVV